MEAEFIYKAAAAPILTLRDVIYAEFVRAGVE